MTRHCRGPGQKQSEVPEVVRSAVESADDLWTACERCKFWRDNSGRADAAATATTVLLQYCCCNVLADEMLD